MDQMRSDESTTLAPALRSDAVGLAGDAPAPRGKTGVVIAAAVLFLLVAFAAAAAVWVFVLAAPDSGESVLTQEVAQESPPPAPADADATEPPPVPLKRVFTFRDIFAPLIQPATESAATTLSVTGSTTTTATASANDGILTLQDVVSVDGEPAAVLLLDGQTYTLKAGEAISGTPWKVVSIEGQTVQLQFGDEHVKLSIGQGIAPSTK